MGFAITTWDVAPAAVSRHLPSGIAPELFQLGGNERAFISAVTFLNTKFHVGFAPFLKLRCAQTNYRAYVKRDAARAVWFFATMLDSPFVAMPRHLWGLPWHRGHVQTAHELEAERTTYDWHAQSPGREERLLLRGTGERLGRLDGFEDAMQTHQVLTHPTVGYVRRRNGGVATYGVWHLPLEMEIATAVEARFELFETLGLVEPEQPAHSALVQPATRFLVRLPPRRVRELG